MTRKLAFPLAIAISFAAGCAQEDQIGDVEEEAQSAVRFTNIFGTTSPYTYDGGTLCGQAYGLKFASNVHCCPKGMAMTGAHVGWNLFKCARLESGVDETTIELDERGSRAGMHACAPGKVMIGFYQSANFLICAKPVRSIYQYEYVDNGTQDGVMHVCREDAAYPYSYAMAGIHVGQNKFLCTQ